MAYPFRLVDVFGTGAFTGNPLAVIAGADDLSSGEMQRITRWLNLSETAFLLPPTMPGADYRVRIFTLAHELPFAGHPTLGSCHAWLEAGGRPAAEEMIVQQCGAGLVRVRSDGGQLAFAAPPLLRGDRPTRQEIGDACAVLRIDPAAIVDARWVDNGPGWIAILLPSAEAVLAVEPMRHHDRPTAIGIVGPHTAGGDAAFEIRAIFNDAFGALIEDPVTGSLNASIGQWLFESGRVTCAYAAAQGTRLGRTGRVPVSRDGDGQVWVGGRTVTLFDGVTQAG
ncbi:PhzF family phenazine biosynthesis protein [Sphingomonas sp.]|uniref:PhzF family phenazine biosynthesis protein n=1 Tax=Sphingomonas sp. TaxID=28214 RepID=UPI000DB5371C|nr:PhzF family phenazine biosynthesis protein [Sphingomonas sp.]PZU07993.1 MAG: phenazine biosynthesis protein PhzF [Sphingomonas sp.]